MNHSRKILLQNGRAGKCQHHPKAFVFFDRKTGARRFQVDASADGNMPMDKAACLLAVHCVSRDQEPGDFSAMIAIGDDLIARVAGLASKMILNCAAYANPVRLTERQQAVLEAITGGLSNKEIATQLNVSLRTAKFHVSALLLKFDVSSRGRLTRKLSGLAPAQPDLPSTTSFPLSAVQEYDSFPAQELPRRPIPVKISAARSRFRERSGRR